MYQQISILKDLHYKIKMQSAKEGRSILEVVTEAIENYLKEKGSEK